MLPIRVAVLLDLHPEHFSRRHLLVQELNDAAQLARDLVRHKNET